MRTELNTERLTLRPFALSDAETFSRLASKPEVARMTGSFPLPYPALAVEGWIMMHEGWRRRGSDYVFAIEAHDHNSLIGGGGLHHRDGVWMLGYWIGAPYWGCGYATETAQALLGFAHDDLRQETIVADWFDDNPASGRVLEKIGFTPTGESYPAFSLARGECAQAVGMEWRKAAAA